MKKLFVLFLTMLFLTTHATLLSDRSIPSLREIAVYYIKDTLSNAVTAQVHARHGNLTLVIIKNEVVATFTDSSDGKEVLIDVDGNEMLIKIVFPRPIFALRTGEQMFGTFSHVDRTSGYVTEKTSLLLKASRQDLDTTVHTYLMVNNDIQELDTRFFKPGQRLPFGIVRRKTSSKTENLLGEEIHIQVTK